MRESRVSSFYITQAPTRWLLATSLVALLIPGLAVTGEQDGDSSKDNAEKNSARKFRGHIAWSIGQLQLENEFSPADELLLLGLEIDLGKTTWPVGFMVGIGHAGKDKSPELGIFSADEDDDCSFLCTNTAIWELHLGVKKVWHPQGKLKPFISGGYIVSSFRTNVCTAVDSDEICRRKEFAGDTGRGTWVDAGLYWYAREKFHIGLRVEFATLDITLEQHDLNAGGRRIMLLLGDGRH